MFIIGRDEYLYFTRLGPEAFTKANVVPKLNEMWGVYSKRIEDWRCPWYAMREAEARTITS